MMPLTVPEALQTVLDHAPASRVDAVPLLRAGGHILAEPVTCDRDLPPWPKALMDGYAVRAEDVTAAPVELSVVEEIAAGRMPTRTVGRREAARIFTGAPLPAGADCVVNQERTTALAPGRVRVNQGVAAGANFSARGAEARLGQVLLRPETRIRAAEAGVLATVGMASVSVYRRPTVAVLVTGNELVEIDATPGPGQIRNSNAWALLTLVASAGLSCAYLGIARDDRADLRKKLGTALQADVVLTTGGVSVGDHDLVKECLLAEGVEILFDQVKMKPGKPLTFGKRGRSRVFGLPGNPVSGLVGFEIFVRPLLAAVAHDPGLLRPRVRAIAGRRIPGAGERTLFVPSQAQLADSGWAVEPVEWHGSGDLTGLARANAFAIVPADTEAVSAGAELEVVLLNP